MMNEIKFRAKSTAYSGWLYWSIFENPPIGLIPNTICQFSGFADSDGVDIYFDDAVAFTFTDNEDHANDYSGTGIIIRTISMGIGILEDGVISEIWLDEDMWKFKVVGNIHDNHEFSIEKYDGTI